ncbi:MAG: hypothetical protein O3C57_06905, partial [Verrucomicrobia bacterium]|nr:hypothetical protein [Verrucomicrobiota bacterium]
MYFQNRTVTPLLTLTFACAMAWTLSARAQDESARIAELEKKVDALTQDIQRAQYGDVFAKPEQSQYGMGAAAAKVYQIDRGMSIGGYGEALYENFDGDKTSQADFLRAVLYLGHKFDDHWVLNTETEFEHATTDEEGSVSVEFAYLDYLWETALN